MSLAMRPSIRLLGASTLLLVCLTTPAFAFAVGGERVLYNFCSGGSPCTDGESPDSSLVFDAAGNLYGTTQGGGDYGQGTVFRLTPSANGAWTETVLYSFCSAFQCSDGEDPGTSLIFDSTGNLYGTTQIGGLGCQPGLGCGTVFELMPGANGMWTEKVLYSFTGGADGLFPEAALILDATGNLYGTTGGGDADNVGTVFELVRGENGNWTKKTLYRFNTTGTDGNGPFGLVFDSIGNLYGPTGRGGGSGCGGLGCGTVFELKRAKNGEWVEKVLHRFDGNNGSYPDTALIFDASGNLYGTTDLGGAYDDGVVFQLSQLTSGKWIEKVLHNFDNNGRDGFTPNGGLIFDAAGNLYGTTHEGGAYNYGTVFRMKSDTNGKWAEEVLHSFNLNGIDGVYPSAGLIFDADGNLYSTTYTGGAYLSGTVFEIMH